MKPAIALPKWNRRFTLLLAALLYCAGSNGWMHYKGKWDAFTVQLYMANTSLGGSLLLGYFGFATWDDRNHMNACVQDRRRRRPEEDGEGVER